MGGRRRIRLLGALLLVFLCAALGCADPVSSVCPDRLVLEVEGHTVRVPCCTNRPLYAANPGVERAVIVIHGMNRTAPSYHARVVTAATTAGVVDRCIIIAPQFVVAEDIEAHGLDDDVLYWSQGGWKIGDRSRDAPGRWRPVRISSFVVVDHILRNLADAERFPDLTRIVVSGHSAGGQFVNRYAAGNQAEPSLREGCSVRYVVANPSSYVYFNKERALAGTRDQFGVPKPGAVCACPIYNRYRYGLDHLNAYMAAAGPEQLRAQYAARNVYYLLGENDNDPKGAGLDTGCAARMQGAHRLERGLVYYNYLRHYFGEEVAQRHVLRTVPGVGHSSNGIFNSPQGLEALFDVGGRVLRRPHKSNGQ